MSELEQLLKEQKVIEEKIIEAKKKQKREAVEKVKQMILDFAITKGDIRGNAMKQLLGSEYDKLYPQKNK